jgi:hypothetical protein
MQGGIGCNESPDMRRSGDRPAASSSRLCAPARREAGARFEMVGLGSPRHSQRRLPTPVVVPFGVSAVRALSGRTYPRPQACCDHRYPPWGCLR